MFETGANRWRTFNQWPPKTTPWNLYLAQGRGLTVAPGNHGADAYRYDPAKPTPYLANPKEEGRPGDLLARDVTWATKRADVLTFRSSPLTRDRRVAGPVQADVWMTTTGTDADVIVTVGEQNAQGQVRPVRWEVIRGRFRESFERPKPFVPGRPARVPLTLNDVLHTFRKGSRIVVMVQSAAFPLIDRNPNRFVKIVTAKPSDYVPAKIRILRGKAYPSRVRLGELTPTAQS